MFIALTWRCEVKPITGYRKRSRRYRDKPSWGVRGAPAHPDTDQSDRGGKSPSPTMKVSKKVSWIWKPLIRVVVWFQTAPNKRCVIMPFRFVCLTLLLPSALVRNLPRTFVRWLSRVFEVKKPTSFWNATKCVSF